MSIPSDFALTFYYVALSGVLCLLLWTPYIAARALGWGIPAFLHNYPEGFPARVPEQPLWASRAQRAHLNLVETLPAFVAIVVAAVGLGAAPSVVGLWAGVFFWARVVHAVVYIAGLPFVRTPAYLVSWAAVLMLGYSAIA